MMKLRKWQQEALEIDQPFDGGVIRAVMGAGKSIVIKNIVDRNPDKFILVTAPTIRLVDQLAETIGGDIGKLYTYEKRQRRVTVACHASLSEFDGEVDLWISDECHKTENDQVKDAIARIAPSDRVGFTATPWRSSDGERLSLFSELLLDYGPAQAIADGVVVAPKIHHATTAGAVDEVCADWIRGRNRGIASANTIEDAKLFAAFLNNRDVKADAIHSQQSRDRRNALLSDLETGAIDCLVHVNLLSEGVDLPWLTFLVLRRTSASKVRFSQEVGRVLRSYPGKTRADIFDPHDLFNLLELDYEACLGQDFGEDAEEHIVAHLKLTDILGMDWDELSEDGIIGGVPVKALHAAESWIRLHALHLRLSGQIPKFDVQAKSWRYKGASLKQLGFLEQIAHKIASHEYSKELGTCYHAAHMFSRGGVSDLISVIQGTR